MHRMRPTVCLARVLLTGLPQDLQCSDNRCRPTHVARLRHARCDAGAAGGLDDEDGGGGGAASGSDAEDGNASDEEARAQRAQRAVPELGDADAGGGGGDDAVDEDAAVAALRETKLDKVPRLPIDLAK